MKVRALSEHPVTGARRAMRRRMETGDEAGFTLIELVITVVILPLVIGGIAAALISVFSFQDSVANRIGNSDDEQVASLKFNKDVQSAEQFETVPSPACGTASQTQVLGLQWDPGNAPGGYNTVVSYIQTETTTNTYSLIRQECNWATSSTPSTFTQSPTSVQTVSHNLGNDPTVTVTGGSCVQPATPPGPCNWTKTTGVTSIVLTVDEPGSSDGKSTAYSYTLTGLPGASSSQQAVSTVQQPSNPAGCNFATPGSGTYADELCFVDFTNWTNPSTPCTSTSSPNMTLSIADSPDTISFCLSVNTPINVASHVIPTYYNPGSSGYDSEAFMGNNGFYTGISGKPALYQNVNGAYTVATFTDIKVTNSVDEPATGWTLVTGDAESTDTNEWMSFTSNLDWSILPNDGANDLWGDACYDSKDTGDNGVLQWTGAATPTDGTVGSPSTGPPSTSTALSINTGSGYSTPATTILCESNIQLNKTGTLMLAANQPQDSLTPQTLTVAMQGAGLEGMFLGVLL